MPSRLRPAHHAPPLPVPDRHLAIAGLALDYIGLVLAIIIGVFFGLFTMIMETASKGQ